ncbi:glycosyl hydrolase family 65 protein [Pseudogracilibacillus sp. SE30717A]|uniref:glycoside hydrolase family 65 protein n=1 Tax=Pseudogracilibacillus sp. SE30717A TaxID=3098293 RepID=UPI00300E6D7F
MSWSIYTNSTDRKQLALEESLYFTGNGYIGIRGNLEEENASSDSIVGTYINGFYDDVPIPYGEKMHGFPDYQQKLLNVIDPQSIVIWVGTGEDREKLSLLTGKVVDYKRALHMDKGFSERYIHWRSKQGHELKITFKRLASFKRKNLFFQQIFLCPVTKNIPIQIISSLNGNVTNYTNPNDPRVGNDASKRLFVKHMKQQNGQSYIELQTKVSELSVAALSELKVHHDHVTYNHFMQNGELISKATFVLKEKTTIGKRTFFADTLRYTNLEQTLGLAREEASVFSFFDIQTEQQDYLASFWKKTDIIIEKDHSLQEAIRFNLFHILQSTGQDGRSNIAAKGLSGEGYEGHYFWDTEIYLLPIYTMTNPEMAKKLLFYRYSILPQAKQRAYEMGHSQGALFPWRTISGTECSSFFPAGTAQYHISADIAHSYIQYYLATDDVEFMKQAGAEMLVETARLWMDVGHFTKNSFRIDAITGPDEYTCIVNNNYYTNVMAKQNLRWAVKICTFLQETDTECWGKLKSRLNISYKELDCFEKAAQKMYLPVDEKLKINPQDDTFLQKAKWDFKHTSKDKYPLLLHYHPLTIYRYQVCKQADTVLAHLLQEDEQSEVVMKNSYDYYERITPHDSSLSTCVFSMMAARLTYLDKAYDYYLQAARLDLDDVQGNTKDGLHMANMGGTWMGIVVGFAGMRIKESGLYFRPQLPTKWNKYTFSIQYKGRMLHIIMTKKTFTIELLKGSPLLIHVWDKPVQLINKEVITNSVSRGMLNGKSIYF